MLQIAINMAMSIDGKIATKARGPVKLGSDYDSQRMDEIRALHDLVLNGASTYKAHPLPLSVGNPDLIKARLKKGLPTQPISAIVSSALVLPKNTPFQKATSFERWIFCGKKAPKKALAFWEKAGVRLIQSKSDRASAKEMCRAFERAGLKNVLLEGGGELNASFLEQGLVNRLYLTLCPILVGGKESPTFFEGKGFLKEKFPSFRLLDCKQVGAELYLVYER